LMRRVKDGDRADAEMSPVGHIALDAVLQKSLITELDEILANLTTGKVKTNVTIKKP